jgi:lysyl-tRNA synthetase class 2
MSAEDNLIQIRRDKHEELNGSAYPLAEHRHYNFIEHESSLMSCHDEYGSGPRESLNPDDLYKEEYYVRGRITTLRKSGGLTFIKVTDSTGTLQVIFAKNHMADYDRLRLLDLGDFIEVTGYSCRTKAGELSMFVTKWNLLTKAYRQPPEKFHGLADTEIKYRQRYIDLMSSDETRARIVARSCIVRGLRKYLEDSRFIEVETPTLVPMATGANAKPFTTHHNALDSDLTLRIAPELYLKRCLVGGMDRVYEIGRNYRNEGISTRHNPEFTMLEFYQAYGNFEDLINHTKSIISAADHGFRWHMPRNLMVTEVMKNHSRDYFIGHYKTVPMVHAVIEACDKADIHIEFASDNVLHDIRIGHWTDGDYQPNERLRRIDVKGMWHALDQCATVGEEIMALFEYVAEPFLTEDYREVLDGVSYSVPVFITEFPAEVCPLARRNDQKPYVCDRFELFINGMEVANGFQELNNPDEQAEKFKEQLESNQKDPMAYDADYVEALEYGMPPAIGCGIGIDRLVMLMTNASSIKDVILFPTLKQEK